MRRSANLASTSTERLPATVRPKSRRTFRLTREATGGQPVTQIGHGGQHPRRLSRGQTVATVRLHPESRLRKRPLLRRVLCVSTIGNFHLWSSASEKLRISASSIQFTYWLTIAVCRTSSAAARRLLLTASSNSMVRSPGRRFRPRKGVDTTSIRSFAKDRRQVTGWSRSKGASRKIRIAAGHLHSLSDRMTVLRSGAAIH